LDRQQRDQALFALAEDYQKAGLFDRAEKLFLQLCAVPGQRQRAMASLIRIYELQKDWAQAIEVRRKLGVNSSTHVDGGAAHAYCELAQQAIDAGDLAGARSHLRKARVNGTQLLRSAYMRAQVAEVQNDFRAATKLYRWMIEEDESFAIEVLPRLLQCLRAVGGDENVAKILRQMLKKQPDLTRLVALAALTHKLYDHAFIMDSLRSFFAVDSFAGRVVAAVADADNPQVEQLTDAQIRRICRVLSDLVGNRCMYECQECGYSGNVLYWQCPGCKNWDTTRPITALIGGSMRSAG
ncbi:MAG: hypothetical protein HKN70_01695, partial [Gammaproteobacteria bacterium]|nr:hypothetical protein [Gammaproteobacteria bacterium]